MNILLWVFQALLGLLCLGGGYYKTTQFDALASQFPALGPMGWRALGLLELIGATLLIVPAATGWMPALTPLAAAVLALESLALCVFYGRYSLKLNAENPLIWSALMAILAVVVAYGRYAFTPIL